MFSQFSVAELSSAEGGSVFAVEVATLQLLAPWTYEQP